MSGLGLTADSDRTWQRRIERHLRKVARDAIKCVNEENTCAARLEGYLASKLWPGVVFRFDELRDSLERYFRVFHGLSRADFRVLSWQERADQLLADFEAASRVRRGRKRRTDTPLETKLFQAWDSDQYESFKDLADGFNTRYETVKRVIRRFQARARRP
jgi:hypothetical protein